jgi:DNA-binding transcriptional MerR regulator
VVLFAGLAGCSLISFKSPERPLSPRDMNARILTRELTTHFIDANGRNTDSILATETDPAVINNALRWEVGVIVATRQAETQLAPRMSLLDTWALALQLEGFVGQGGAGAKLFGTHQAAVRSLTEAYAGAVHTLARSLLTPSEFADYQSFINDYVSAHPLQDLKFARVSVIEEWGRAKGAQSSLLDEVGTIPQALADTNQRLQIYADTVPVQTLRRTQLALRETGYTPDDVRAAMARLDARLERLTVVAETAPDLVRGAEDEVRESLHEILNRLDASVAASASAFRTERAALFVDIQAEREALTTAVDAQRKALTADAARIGEQLVRSSGEEVRHFTRQAELFVILLAIVVLGLPFAAGYLVGRARSSLRPE